MRLASLVMALMTLAFAGIPAAEARPHNAREDGGLYAYPVRILNSHSKQRGYSQSQRRSRSTRNYRSRGRHYAHRGTGARPRKWCGWWMRTQLGGGPEYNRAAHWKNYGRPSGPQVGAVVVWPHHVGIITGRASNGRWIVKSGNDGGRVRERARSVAGAVFRVA